MGGALLWRDPVPSLPWCLFFILPEPSGTHISSANFHMLFWVCSLVLVLCMPPTLPQSFNTFFDPYFLPSSCLQVLLSSLVQSLSSTLFLCPDVVVFVSLRDSCLFFPPPPLCTWQTVGTVFVPIAGVVYACKGLNVTFSCNNILSQDNEYCLG